MAYGLLSKLVSFPSVTYDVASSHTESAVVPTFFMLVRGHMSLHMPLIQWSAHARPFLLFTLMIQVKDLLNPIFSLKQFFLIHPVLLFSCPPLLQTSALQTFMIAHSKTLKISGHVLLINRSIFLHMFTCIYIDKYIP